MWHAYPLGAVGIAAVYNLKGVSDLVLTTLTLAKIWSGRITTWDHPDIVAGNPNFTNWNVPVNQSITLVARAETVGATLIMKSVMKAADPTFPAAAPKWGSLVTPIVYSSATGLVAHVLRNPYSLSYAAPGDAVGLVPMARLSRSGAIVECNDTSVQYAVLEKGLSFGNNGDDPVHLTGDLTNAVNPLAWPAVGWVYVAVRKATLRPGATCATAAALVRYWLWFWNSPEVATILDKLSNVPLPEVVRDEVVARFKQDMYCGGRLVWQEAAVPVVSGCGPESAIPVFDKFQQAYTLVNSSMALNYTAFTSDQTDPSVLLQTGGFLVSTAPSAMPGVYSLVLGSEAVVAVSTMSNLVLDGPTLAKILNGDITTWLHSDIVALNPGGLRANGKLLNDTAQQIVLLQGPTATSAPLTALLRQYYPAYTGAAIRAAERLPRETLLWSGVIGSPFAFSVSVLVGTLPTELQAAAILSGGAPVAPTLATARACTTAATYDATSKAVALSSSGNSSCYPLLLTLYVNVQRQCPAPPATARTVAFLRWMFAKDTLAAALDALNLVSLYGVSNDIRQANDAALFQLSCQTPPTPMTPTDLLSLLLGVIVPIAVVVSLGLAACAWWVWRITEHNRVMRKKFSNDNVAESCAEAIARFDLAALEWLQEVKEPNKIQRAFLAIVTLLTEVKPYMPDQLLARLIAQSAADVGDAEEVENILEDEPSPTNSCRRRPSHASAAQTPAHSPRPVRRDLSTVFSDVNQLPLRDWRCKRCTYMCVRFGSTFPNDDERLPEMVRVAGQIVDVAKAHGATMDAVGVDFVTVHWGVATVSAAAALRAIQAGLEVGQLRATLPEDQRGAFWLQMGIGKGLCDCGTVSTSSGHRFFVVWGPEASLALDVAMRDFPKRVLASLLVSPAVYQEVQFTVRCMPRLWHGDALLWEPLGVLKKKEDDEWMYELQQLDPGAALYTKAVLDAFLMAKGERLSAAGLPAYIATVRAQHSGAMSAQDSTALDQLLAGR
eukprot:EG_transcript_749